MFNLWTNGEKIHSTSPIRIYNIYTQIILWVSQTAVSSSQHLRVCILHSIDNLSLYTAVDPFIMKPSGNTDTVTFIETSLAQVRINKASSGTMERGRCERLIQIGIWDVGFVIPITERSKHKVSDKDFGIFITAQNNFVGRAGPEINIHYVCINNRFILSELWEWKIMGNVPGNHNLCGNCASNKNKKKWNQVRNRALNAGRSLKKLYHTAVPRLYYNSLNGPKQLDVEVLRTAQKKHKFVTKDFIMGNYSREFGIEHWTM